MFSKIAKNLKTLETKGQESRRTVSIPLASKTPSSSVLFSKLIPTYRFFVSNINGCIIFSSFNFIGVGFEFVTSAAIFSPISKAFSRVAP